MGDDWMNSPEVESLFSPRMIRLEPLTPPKAPLSVTLMPARECPRSTLSTTPACSRADPEMAVILCGTFCADSARRVAVTTISCSCGVCSALAGTPYSAVSTAMATGCRFPRMTHDPSWRSYCCPHWLNKLTRQGRGRQLRGSCCVLLARPWNGGGERLRFERALGRGREAILLQKIGEEIQGFRLTQAARIGLGHGAEDAAVERAQWHPLPGGHELRAFEGRGLVDAAGETVAMTRGALLGIDGLPGLGLLDGVHSGAVRTDGQHSRKNQRRSAHDAAGFRAGSGPRARAPLCDSRPPRQCTVCRDSDRSWGRQSCRRAARWSRAPCRSSCRRRGTSCPSHTAMSRSQRSHRCLRRGTAVSS